MESLEGRQLLAYFVTSATDNNPLGGGEGSGNSGDLRYCITQASTPVPGIIESEPDVIRFQLPANTVLRPGTSSAGDLGPTALPIPADGVGLVIDASASPGLVIDGEGARRLFTVAHGANVTFRSFTIRNGLAQGGDGGNGWSGGGGAAGLGGAILLDRGTLTLDRITLNNNAARGGNGGYGNAQRETSGPTTAGAGGGGGGMGGSARGQDALADAT